MEQHMAAIADYLSEQIAQWNLKDKFVVQHSPAVDSVTLVSVTLPGGFFRARVLYIQYDDDEITIFENVPKYEQTNIWNGKTSPKLYGFLTLNMVDLLDQLSRILKEVCDKFTIHLEEVRRRHAEQKSFSTN